MMSASDSLTKILCQSEIFSITYTVNTVSSSICLCSVFLFYQLGIFLTLINLNLIACLCVLGYSGSDMSTVLYMMTRERVQQQQQKQVFIK